MSPFGVIRGQWRSNQNVMMSPPNVVEIGIIPSGSLLVAWGYFDTSMDK